jgi:hypothetical protein
MPITVKIGKDPQAKITLNARKNLRGDVLIFDHEDIDIVIMSENNKVVSFAKDSISDKVYEAQERLFNFLRKKGIIDISSVQGGNIYGSMEAAVLESINEGISSIEATLYVVSKFLNEEKPYFTKRTEYEDNELDYLVDPDDEHSTELGEVPHEERKGSLMPGYIRGPYGMTSFYRY